MATDQNNHVSWTKLWAVIAIFAVPCFGGIIMAARGTQQVIDKLDVVIIKQDKGDSRMDKFEEKLNAVSVRVDTISHRQEINTLKQDFRFQIQQSTRQAVPAIKQRYYTQHRDNNGNVTMQ